jgi:PAS domain S-box-containing protein
VDFQEDIHRRVFEAIPEGIWVVNPQGQTIFSNRRMADILRVDYESMPGQWCFAYVYPEELEEAQRQFARGLSGDRSSFEFRLCRADGSPIWVSISSMRIFDETGAPVAILGLFSDITERKNAEAALKESEERFRHMANSAPVMLWMTDTEISDHVRQQDVARLHRPNARAGVRHRLGRRCLP